MWDWWKDVGSKTSDFFKNNSDTFSGLGALIGGVGGAYGAYQQGKMNQKMHSFNMDLLREEKRRRDKAEKNIEAGWLGALAKRKEEEEKKQQGGW